MSIVAKFRCHSVTKFENGEDVRLEAVTGKTNEPWSKWTPSGSLTISITNPSAQAQLEPGKNYRILIEPMPDGED